MPIDYGDQKAKQAELDGLNSEIRRVVDQVAAKEILEGTPDGATIRRWRLSMRMTITSLATSIRQSRRHLIRIEQGEHRVSAHFLEQLRPFVRLCADGALPYVPHGITTYPLPPRNPGKWVNLTRVVGLEARGEWRECPICHETKLYLDKRAVYCSALCTRQAQKEGRTFGVKNNARLIAAGKGRRVIRCPHCQLEHAMVRSYLKADGVIDQPADRPALIAALRERLDMLEAEEIERASLGTVRAAPAADFPQDTAFSVRGSA